jgi:hypothetical protein
MSEESPASKAEKLALDLPENQRGELAARLLKSLPPLLADGDEGIAEALRRDADFETDPDLGISLEEFRRQVQKRSGLMRAVLHPAF